MGRLAVSKRHEKRVGVEAGHVLRIRRTANKETMWMLMRNKPTRYHSDNDTKTQLENTFTLYSNSERAYLHRVQLWGHTPSGTHASLRR